MLQSLYPIIAPFILESFNFVFFNKGDFPPEFKTSYIRLIPKSNNNLSSIKSWRPISIGSSVYKLYSKVLSNRIKKILPKILNKSQKAYLPDRNISELILNIQETISSSIRTNTPMYMVSVDIARAFDSVSHTFILDTLKYFNFPISFINVVKTWLSHRKSCISLPHGLSEFFLIANGVPQGDSLSGYIFILCLEILNLKFRNSNIPQPNVKLPLNTPSLPAEFFADDSNFFVEFDPRHLRSLKRILNEFYLCSGLSLNVKKTKVMIIGSPYTQFDINEIEQIGFTHTTSTTILGFHIDEKLDDLDFNWTQIVNKLTIISNIWSMHKPSITAKIDLIKMFFLSKLGYPASCILPPPEIINRIENVICSFLFPTKNTFPKARIFSSIKEGGLGIPNIKDFCSAMFVKSAMRAMNSPQPWAISLKKHFPNENISLFAKVPVIPKSSIPLLIERLNEMHRAFYRTNFYSSPLFNSLAPLTIYNTSPLLPPPTLQHSNFIQCRVQDIYNFEESRVYTLHEISTKFDIEIPYLIYFRLFAGITAFTRGNAPP